MTAIEPTNSQARSAAAEEWVQFTRRLAEVGLAIHDQADGPRTEDQRRDINRVMMTMLSGGALYELEADPRRPQWLPWLNPAYSTSAANADNSYYVARIGGSGSYRIAGHRGTSARIGLQVSEGFYGFPGPMRKLAEYEFDDLGIAKGEPFELIIGGERPAGFDGPWLPLESTSDNVFLLLRHITYDWDNEEPGYFTIRPLEIGSSGSGRGQAREPFGELAAGFVEKFGQLGLNILKSQRYDDAPINLLEDYTETFNPADVLTGQWYFGGKFRLADDEAVVLEITIPPDGDYWMIQLLDHFFASNDWMYTQASLNCYLARKDVDGKVRVVMSRRDPGIQNWLDKGDAPEFAVRMRAFGGGRPTVGTTVLPFASLKDHLPPETPSFSAAEREAALARRIDAVQKRRSW